MDYEKEYFNLCKLIVDSTPKNLLSIKILCEEIIKKNQKKI